MNISYLQIEGGYMANNCLKCKSEIPEDRIYCDKCISKNQKNP